MALLPASTDTRLIMAASQSGGSWTCPQCQRRVPGQLQQCRCGFEYIHDTEAAEPATAVEGSGAGRTLGLLLVLIGLGVAVGVFFSFSTNSSEQAPADLLGDQSQLATPANRTAVAAPVAPVPPGPTDAAPRLSLPESETIVRSSPTPPPVPVAEPSLPSGDRSIEDIIDASEGAVALIEAGQVRGTGFFIGPDTVLTNVHVVESTSFVTVKLTDGTAIPARVERTLPNVDIALLKTSKPHPRQSALQLGTYTACVRARK